MTLPQKIEAGPLPIVSFELPADVNKIVVFDTNAYRVLTSNLALPDIRSLALDLRRLEASEGFFPLANPIVIWELVTHLADSTDPARERCMNALVLLAEHTWSTSGVRSFSDPVSTVCRSLFGTIPESAARDVAEFNKLAGYVKDNAPTLTTAAAINNFQHFAMRMRANERKWLLDMQNLLTSCDPSTARSVLGGKNEKEVRQKLRDLINSQAYFEGWSLAAVRDYGEKVGWRGSESETSKRATAVREVFSVPFYLMKTLTLKLVDPSPVNLVKRVNFMADYEICFSVGGFHEIKGAQMFLVTGDRAIREAAQLAGCADRVLLLSDYKNAVHLI